MKVTSFSYTMTGSSTAEVITVRRKNINEQERPKNTTKRESVYRRKCKAGDLEMPLKKLPPT